MTALRERSATLDGEGVVCGADGVTFDLLELKAETKGGDIRSP
jgi:hypothetical protein